MFFAKINHIPIQILFLILLLILTSCFGYFSRGDAFWLRDFPVFVLGILVMLCGIILVNKVESTIYVGKIDLLFFLYHVYVLLHAFVASYPYLPTNKLIVPLISVLFYIFVRIVMRLFPEKFIPIFITGILISTLLQSCVGVLQELDVLKLFHRDYRSSGLFVNPGIYAGFLVVGFCTTIFYSLNAVRRNIRMFYIVGAIFIGVCVIISQSRTSWVAALCGTGLLLSLMYPDQFMTVFIKRKLYLPFILILIVIGIFLLIRINPDSVNGRFLIWKISVDMVKQNPIFGLGYDSFYSDYGNYQAAYFFSTKGTQEEIMTASMNYFAFNEFLRIQIEEGIVGLLIFIGLIISALGVGLSRIFAAPKKNNIALFIVILIVILLLGIFSYPFSDLSMIFIFLTSIAVIAEKDRTTKTIHLSSKNVNRFKTVIKSFFILVLLLCTANCIALLLWRQAKLNLSLSEGDSLSIYRKIYPMLSTDGSFLYNYGRELLDLEQHQNALSVLKRATRYSNSMELHTALAETYENLQNTEEAESSYLKAAYLNPKLFVPFYSLFNFYKNTAQIIKARNVSIVICEKPVKIASPIIWQIKQEACKFGINEQ